jgi:hypothetical protein
LNVRGVPVTVSDTRTWLPAWCLPGAVGITDPFGHRWGLAQDVRDVSKEEIAKAAAGMFGG